MPIQYFSKLDFSHFLSFELLYLGLKFNIKFEKRKKKRTLNENLKYLENLVGFEYRETNSMRFLIFIYLGVLDTKNLAHVLIKEYSTRDSQKVCGQFE